ncbi:hypothetical protein [Streptomyces sp. PanSC9]|uniref:hypothetical protein n=1 Tax=Streptomyces sp. PanSC9 TaxID=1520461 RepID=UPI000F495746|nr:hypothetical protein [Streptomyces sp. PanSC9]ROP48033.1 hypothetical protein EDD94_7770 [Streptomyces sp. PanSC9]
MSHYDNNKSATVYLYADGDYAGYVNWNADPDSFGNPGDALRAHDGTADGYGVRGVTYDAFDRFVVERKVSTYGHSSPYTTSWNTGNLTEGSVLGLEVCVGTTSNLVRA